MARILRGDIFWADLNPVKGHEQAGHRPVLILSHEVFNQRSGTVIIMALTGQPQRAGFPLTLEIKSKKLPKKSWIKMSQITPISTGKLGKKIGSISVEDVNKAVEGLNEIIS